MGSKKMHHLTSTSTFRSEEETKQLILKRLIETFQDDGEILARILFFLDEEEQIQSLTPRSKRISPTWRSLTLLHTMGSVESFTSYAKKLAEATKQPASKDEFCRSMLKLHKAVVSEDGEGDEELVEPEVDEGENATGLLQNWDIIPFATRGVIVQLAKSMLERCGVSGNEGVVNSVVEYTGKVVEVGLAAVYLSFQAVQSIRHWLRGEISGKRCCKNVIDSCASVGAGLVGGIAGIAVGTALAGPIGGAVGGIVTAAASASIAKSACKFLTRKAFGLPKEAALENAYRFFNLGMHPNNVEINEAYRNMCRIHHPDKGGSKEEFQLVQVHMTVIKLRRDGK